jgi:hypothetical protein
MYARGIRALHSHTEGEFLFSRDASTTPIVATAVYFFGEYAEKVFTRGDFSLSDNFDWVEGRVCAVENFAFGGGKLYLEHREAHAFVSDHVRWPAARVLEALPKFAKLTDRFGDTLDEAVFEAHPEYLALHDAPDSTLAREHFLSALVRRHVEDVNKEVLNFGRSKGVGLKDPVFAAASRVEEELRELAESGRATVFDYFNVRLALVDHVPHANPRFAKLAFGRGAMWGLIQESWEELSRCEWTVFFVRRLQLARQPDLALTFLMLNHGGSLHCEVSPHDDDWAVKLQVPKGAESPLDPLFTVGGLEAFASVWERVRSPVRPRRLGRANALVARSLLLRTMIEGEAAAAAELQAAATGWVAWVDRCLPGEGSLLSQPLLPFGGAEALPPLRGWLKALSAGLNERAAASAPSTPQ